MGLIGRIDRFLGKAVLRTFGSVFFVAGSIAGYHAAGQLTLAWEARNWPLVEGQVLESALRGGGPLVRYQYVVGDQVLESTTVHIGQYKGIESHAREIVERYPSGTKTPVYYQPDDPQTTVLEHRFPWTSLLLLFMAAGFLGGAYLCFRSRRSFTQIVAEAADGS